MRPLWMYNSCLSKSMLPKSELNRSQSRGLRSYLHVQPFLSATARSLPAGGSLESARIPGPHIVQRTIPALRIGLNEGRHNGVRYEVLLSGKTMFVVNLEPRLPLLPSHIYPRKPSVKTSADKQAYPKASADRAMAPILPLS